MSDGMYLTVMLGALTVLIVVLVPTMFFERCINCGARNGLNVLRCRKCDSEMPR